MNTTIYNIVMIIISLFLVHTGNITALTILYVVLCIGAIIITYSVNLVVKDYPKISSKQKDNVESVFYEIAGYRFSNYIGSYICHAWILFSFVNDTPLLITITAVLFYRTLSLYRGYTLVRKEKINE